MIYLGFLLALVFLISTAYHKVKHKKWHDMYWDENRIHQETAAKLSKAEEEINQLNNQVELFEEALRQKEGEAEEKGGFVRQRQLRPATPETYRVVFDLDINGQRILEDLTQRYCRNAFSSTDRETNYKLGQQHVVNHIINQINKANDPALEESNDD